MAVLGTQGGRILDLLTEAIPLTFGGGGNGRKEPKKRGYMCSPVHYVPLGGIIEYYECKPCSRPNKNYGQQYIELSAWIPSILDAPRLSKELYAPVKITPS